MTSIRAMDYALSIYKYVLCVYFWSLLAPTCAYLLFVVLDLFFDGKIKASNNSDLEAVQYLNMHVKQCKMCNCLVAQRKHKLPNAEWNKVKKKFNKKFTEEINELNINKYFRCEHVLVKCSKII